ncbi:MAG: cytochrome c biogenesis protein ResB [Rubrivivax sp.]|jgi:cytochrome c biogenesis protein|nr:cytochrome c biogenesis protein ResB [Rubrivivax sp.]
MNASTSGIEIGRGSRAWREAVELLSSMRFAIALLTLICIASVIGTVVKQNEPFNNYVNQFGPFWADVFAAVGLYNVYSAPWFLLILGFLVVSTSLCIARNTPKILADLRSYKESVREQSLLAFHHKGRARVAESPDAALQRVATVLAAEGWRARVQPRGHGTMIAARKGGAHKLGYLAAHSAVVLICVGGLLDGDLVVKAQMALFGKTPFEGGGLVADVPAEHRLSERNPTFRANLFVPEGARAGTALIAMADGVVLQDLPFDVELERFIVEYHATGMPKLFASEVIVHDRDTGRATPYRIEVNKPAVHRGITIYQSSFDDGGSRVALRAEPMRAGAAPFEVSGQVGGATELAAGRGGLERPLRLEFAALRVINVEDFGSTPAAGSGATGVRAVDLVHSIESRLGSGARVVTPRELRNVGPSVTYRLRDESGQAREFHNYMAPVEIDGRSVFLAGVRDTPQESFRYLRIPADGDGRIDGWMRLRRALDDAAMRDEAARRYVSAVTPDGRPEMAEQLLLTTQRALALFAGAVPADEAARKDGHAPGGLQALVDFIEAGVPEAERERISEVLLRLLNGSLFELLNMSREQAGQPRLQPGDEAEAFMVQAVTSLSDSFLYPAPFVLQLAEFTQVQASVFQVARAPGKTLVYLGCVALIVGIFVMLYVRERRLWIWLEADDDAPSHTRITTALSTTRRTLEADQEFERLRQTLLQEPR